jgi:hypothetical protein
MHKKENFTSIVVEPGVEPSSSIESFKALLYSVAVQESSDVLTAVPKITRHTNIIVSVLPHMQFCVTNQNHFQPYDFFMVTSANIIT